MVRFVIYAYYIVYSEWVQNTTSHFNILNSFSIIQIVTTLFSWIELIQLIDNWYFGGLILKNWTQKHWNRTLLNRSYSSSITWEGWFSGARKKGSLDLTFIIGETSFHAHPRQVSASHLISNLIYPHIPSLSGIYANHIHAVIYYYDNWSVFTKIKTTNFTFQWHNCQIEQPLN